MAAIFFVLLLREALAAGPSLMRSESVDDFFLGNTSAQPVDCSFFRYRLQEELTTLDEFQCTRAKWKCGKLYCPARWVETEQSTDCVIQTVQECGINCRERQLGVCSMQDRVNCQKYYQKHQDTHWVCKWSHETKACYMGGQQDSQVGEHYPRMANKCYAMNFLPPADSQNLFKDGAEEKI
mmetsp:Transcript_93630/g.166603  ORF Transcript_93630/g.166603 Transcript_93630/m.166603 type:complete len:181 (-) Transcript_93630:133-675(-)